MEDEYEYYTESEVEADGEEEEDDDDETIKNVPIRQVFIITNKMGFKIQTDLFFGVSFSGRTALGGKDLKQKSTPLQQRFDRFCSLLKITKHGSYCALLL